MATDLEQKRKNAAPAKYESFVENQLARVRGRVRALDAGRAVLLFLIVTLAYALVTSQIDRLLVLPTGVRLAGFLVYLLGALCLLGWAGLCLTRPVNPYYAAVQLEHTLPDAKNSVVNWLDLRDEKLPAAIHGALGLRAARDLKKADPEQAVNAGTTWLLAGVLGGLILAALILFVMGPQQFTSLLQRAFAPFREGGIATRTEITIVSPEGGNATVRPNRPLTFRAQIDGRFPSINQPGAPQLEYRYNPADPFAPKALEQDHDGTWYWTMPADLVINGGLSYRVTAGDAATQEYQINVSVIPQVREIDVSYVFRPYLRLPDRSKPYQRAVFPGLKAPRGTQAAMIIRTNCAVRDGTLQVHWTGDPQPTALAGAPVPNDPTALSFSPLLLDRDGSFSFLFNSKDGEPNQDRLPPYSITIIHDKTPTVEIKKPKDAKLPANGTLSVEGSASDDFGIKSMTLGMAFLDGTKKRLLERKPYRPDFSFKLVNGTYPDALEYRDVVPLEKLKTIDGTPFPLKKDMVLEYWLEAVDNSDYPTKTGNVGKSTAYKVIILDPEKDQQKQKQDRQQAEQEKQKHDQKQKDDIDKQNDKIAKEPKKDDQPQTKPDQQKNSDAKKKEDELAKAADDLKKKLEKNEKQQGDKQPDQKQNAGDNPKQDNPGEAKAQDQPKSDQKDGNAESKAQEPKAKEGNKDGKGNDGQQKDAKPGQDKSSQAKDGGDNKPGQKNDATEAKGPGKDNSDAGPKGESKDAAADKQKNDAKDDKSAAKEQPKTPSAGAKDKGAKGDEQKTGQAKDSGGSGGDKAGGNEAKGKGAGKDPPNSQAKDGGAQGQQEQVAGKGDSKPAPADPKDQAAAKGKEPTRTEISEAKGPPPERPQPKSDAKGPEKNEPVAQTKAPPGNPAPDKQPQAKNTGPNSPSPSQAKETNPGKSTSAAKDKGTGGTDSQKTDKQPSAEDIAKLKKDLKGGDPQAQKKAEEELSRLAKDAKDDKSREAAEEALREANKLPMRAKDAGESGDKTAKSAPKEEGQGKSAKEGAAKEGTPEQNAGASKGQEGDPKTQESAKKGDAKGKNGGTLAGKSSVDQPGTAQAANKDFSKKIGNLTLEDMKKLAETTAAKRKEAGIDEAQWQNFLKDLRDYEDWLRRMNAQSAKNTSPNVKGTSSALKSVGPRQVNPTGKLNSTPIEVVQPLPPPEFREAQRLFTTPSQNGKKQ